MSNSARLELPSTAIPAAVPLAELLNIPAPAARWLWDGFLAAGKVTLLTSLWKSGKTTLLSVLLAKMNGGGELAGRCVKAARPLIISEESPDYWGERGRRLGLAPDVSFLCQPFRSKPSPNEWQQLMDRIEMMIQETRINFLVIDPLATFLPGRDENNATLMLEALLPLKALTRRGVAVLMLHHPRKSAADLGHSARGSGALVGHADILLELRPYPNAGESDRRRRLCGLSRFAETPRQIVIELNDAGTDYAYLGEIADAVFTSNWEVLNAVLTDADDRLTRKQIWEKWPIVEVRPDEATLWRWLERAVCEGKVMRAGTGLRNGPYRYWLAESEARWKRDPFYMAPLESFGEIESRQAVLPPEIQRLVDAEKKRNVR